MNEILLVHTESTEITENNKYTKFTQKARKSRGNDFMNEILIRLILFNSLFLEFVFFVFFDVKPLGRCFIMNY